MIEPDASNQLDFPPPPPPSTPSTPMKPPEDPPPPTGVAAVRGIHEKSEGEQKETDLLASSRTGRSAERANKKPAREETPPPPCKAFQRGRCTAGKRCRFSHDTK